MIEVLLHTKPLGKFKSWKWRDGNRYCLHLVRILIYTTSRMEYRAEPFYQPLFSINKVGGEIDICHFIGSKTIVSYIGKHPWIQVINDSK